MSRSTRLTLICRGATVSARKGIFGSDEPLADGESARAARLSGILPDVAVVFSGPEASARETAAALSARTPIIDPGLSDIAYGRWQGKMLKDVAEAEPAALQAWMSDAQAAPHGGESVTGLHARISAWLDAHRDQGGALLAVTHPAVIRAIVLRVLDAPPASFWRIDVETLSMTELTSDGRRWALRSAGASLRQPQTRS